jgi:hypothetical protein
LHTGQREPTRVAGIAARRLTDSPCKHSNGLVSPATPMDFRQRRERLEWQIRRVLKQMAEVEASPGRPS